MTTSKFCPVCGNEKGNCDCDPESSQYEYNALTGEPLENVEEE